MSAKIFLVFCAQALFVQSALSQCTSRAAVAAAPGIAAPAFSSPYGLGASYGLGAPYGRAAPALAASPLAGTYGIATPALVTPGLDYSPTSGGLLPLASGSVVAPIGISVTSENLYEGELAVVGELPFVGTVGLEGVLPTAGVGVVNHACGNGINAMVGESAGYASAYAGAGFAPFNAMAPTAASPVWNAPYARVPELAAPILATSGLEITPTSGGLLPIASGSPVAPVGISVASENAYEGILEAVGELPFVGTVGIEGVLPTAGAGVVNHSCGNGANAMVSERAAFAPAYAGAFAPAYAGAIAPAAAPALGWAGRGCGYAL